MKAGLEKLVIAIGIPLVVGSVSSFLVGDSMVAFAELEKPPIAPPGWVFPVVWTILFVMMGIASYLIYISNAPSQKTSPLNAPSQKTSPLNAPSQKIAPDVVNALKLYGVQLIVNFFWSIIFFGQGWYLVAFLWIILLWVLIFMTMQGFYRISKVAGLLMVPYLLWVTFAGFLNFLIYLIN